MQNVQEVFNRIKETEKKQREINRQFRDALATSEMYKNAFEALKVAREKKKTIENEIKSEFSSEFSRLEGIKLDLKSDKELLSDAALTTLMKGETVQVTDEYDQEYEPIFSVKFKKV